MSGARQVWVRTFRDGRVLVAGWDFPAAEPLVIVLSERLGLGHPGPLHHWCPVCGSIEHGRPQVTGGLELSIAHAAGGTAVAASLDGPVGVDVEVDADPAWVRREATAKAAGVGLVGGELPDPGWVADLDLPGRVGAVALVSEAAREAAVAGVRRARSRRGG